MILFLSNNDPDVKDEPNKMMRKIYEYFTSLGITEKDHQIVSKKSIDDFKQQIGQLNNEKIDLSEKLK